MILSVSKCLGVFAGIVRFIKGCHQDTMTPRRTKYNSCLQISLRLPASVVKIISHQMLPPHLKEITRMSAMQFIFVKPGVLVTLWQRH